MSRVGVTESMPQRGSVEPDGRGWGLWRGNPSPRPSGSTRRRTTALAFLAALLLGRAAFAAGADAAPIPMEHADDAPPPGGASSTVSKALELLEAWDIEGAAKLANELDKTAPDDPGTKFILGRVAFEEGEYTKAAALLKEALGAGATHSQDYQLAIGAEAEVKGMVVEETAHFSIRYKPGKDAALVPYAMETMEAAYSALTKDLGYEPPHKVRMEFYSSPKALARVSSLSEEAIKTTGTIALCKYNRLMVTSPRALWRGYEWQDTVTHEFTHFLVTRKSHNTVPIWLHEGIAKYSETRWRGKAGQAIDASGQAFLTRAVKADKLISFARMHPSIALLPSQEDAALAFAEVESAISFIDEKVGMSGVRAIIDGLKAGKTDREAVAAALGMSFDQFESQWKKSLRSRPMPKITPVIERLVFKDEKKAESKKEREKAYDRGELGMIPNVEARQHAHLGELLRARNRLAPASIEFEKAIAIVGPTFAPLARKYALTKLALGQGAEAEKVLRASIAEFPDEETNHLLLGRILLQTNRAAEAKEHLLIANQRDPFDPEIHEGLLAVAKAANDAGLSARETDVLAILGGKKTTWHAVVPGTGAVLGYLRIETPSGARVLIDGVDTGLTTPVAEHPLPAGDHVVRLEVPGGPPIERTVKVTPDELVPFPSTS